MTHAIDCDLDEDCTCMDKPELPPGAYYDEALDHYIHPDDTEWSPEGYERATGEPWPFEDEDEDEDEDDR